MLVMQAGIQVADLDLSPREEFGILTWLGHVEAICICEGPESMNEAVGWPKAAWEQEGKGRVLAGACNLALTSIISIKHGQKEDSNPCSRLPV